MSVFENNNMYYMSDSVFVSTAHAPQGKVITEHKHDFVEMVYTLKGKCIHYIDGEEYPTGHGDMVIINYNQSHRIVCGTDISYINILIKPEYINMSLSNTENAFSLLNLTEFEDFKKILNESKRKVTFSGKERNRIEEIIEVTGQEIVNQEPGHELAVRSQFNLLLINVFRKMSFEMDGGFNGISDRLLNYINTHCHEKLTLDKVARMCSYNSSYFSRIFKKYSGRTFTQYLKEARIRKAMLLLDTTDMSVTDIIYEVGYGDRTKFFAHFKSFTGISPLKYKKSKK